MAVYTQLGAEALAELIGHYDIGALRSAKGIAEGVSNSNWLIETAGRDGQGARFILTMYEHRVEVSELPYFLALVDHLAAKCPDVRVLARNGDVVAASPVFLNTFGKSLWSPGRGPEQMHDSELVRTGRMAFLKPGEQIPFTVAWHAKDGAPAVVDYGAGSLKVPG